MMIGNHYNLIKTRLKETIKNNKWKLILFISLVFVGVFLRAYNFSHWLHFEIDQSYDTLIVSPAVEGGIGNLPLLGPTAGGGRALRLGPAFYYLEYLSAKLFGNTPPGYAMLTLLFSILSMPFFYLFCRRYFSSFISIGLFFLYCFSLYMVCYGRFSWSPNVLPFILIFGFYALLRSISEDEKKKDLWFIFSSVALVIATQIHFNAFFIIPVMIFLLLIVYRPRFKLRTWAIVLLLSLIIYSPVIISDIATRGENLHYFMEKFRHSGVPKGSAREDFVQMVNYNASEYFLIVSGIDHINEYNLTGYGFLSDRNRSWKIVAIGILFLVLSILIHNLWKEKDKKRKDFLWLIVVWFLISFAYFFSIRRDEFAIYPRFFLMVAPLPFILFGLILEKLADVKKIGTASIVILTVAPLITNAQGLNKYFYQLQNVSAKPILVASEDIFPNTARITLSQQQSIADYMENIYQENHYPVYFQAKHEYEPVIRYALEKKDVYCGEKAKNAIYQEGNYFVIKSTSSGVNRIIGFNTVERINFGTLTLFHIAPKSDSITEIRQNDSEKVIPLEEQQISQLLTWNKLRNGKIAPVNNIGTGSDESTPDQFTEDAPANPSPTNQ